MSKSVRNLQISKGKEARILSGLLVRDKVAQKLQRLISQRRNHNLSIPRLAIIQVGDLPESSAYIRQKKLFGERIGAIVDHVQFDITVTEKEILSVIDQLNKDKETHGIIVQLPLPKQLSVSTVVQAISPKKDVDGLTSTNVQHLMSGDGKGLVPATARGVMSLIAHYGIQPKGKHVVVVGRSALVGGPIAQRFLNTGATVTVCHRLTRPLHRFTSQADILIVAAGSPKLISKKHVRKGQIVIDVGITVVLKRGKRKLVGDVDVEKVKHIIGAYTPVPGGVGPLTVSSLFENLCEVVE